MKQNKEAHEILNLSLILLFLIEKDEYWEKFEYSKMVVDLIIKKCRLKRKLY